MKTNHHSQVVIIGGGATGIGIARDAATRGLEVTLIEAGTMGSGTSGNFHGLLHSGARYATVDPLSARQCYEESVILRQMFPEAVHDTGGLFLATDDEEASAADTWSLACEKAKIPVEEIDISEILKQEPYIARTIRRAFAVPDGYIDGPKLLQINHEAAETAPVPAKFLSHHRVTGFHMNGHTIEAVVVHDVQNNEEITVNCSLVINAAGIWAGKISQLAGIEIPLVADKGSMLLLDKTYSRRVLNHLRLKPGSGDIIVPTETGCILGTTSRPTDDLSTHDVDEDEIVELIHEGCKLIPSIDRSGIVKAFSGVRPLYAPSAGSGRGLSREFEILNHAQEGVSNMISVVGGKFTLYRLMAEKAVDEACKILSL